MLRRPAFTTAFAIILLVLAFAVLMDTWTGAQSQGQRDTAGGPANEDRRLRFTHDGTSDPEVPVEIGHVTAANQWAIDVGMAARLERHQRGSLALRTLAPPAPYLHHGSFL